MNKTFFSSAILAGAALLSACGTVPTTTPELDQARNAFMAASNNPQVSSYAPLEFKQASDALDRANTAAARRESLSEIDKLAYIAKQRIAAAQEVASAKAAEAGIADASRQRDSLRLEARTAEADRAKADADRARIEAERAKMAAASAQSQAEAATRQAMDSDAQRRDAEARAAQLETMMTELHATKTERGMVVTIGDVLFGTDQSSLTPNGMNTLRKLADALNQNPNRTVLVEGFTDSTGTSSHNQELSQRRAASVASALAGMGVPRDRIAMRAYGEAYPVASNNSAGDRQLNRRVEIVLSNEGAAIPPRR